MCQSQDDYIRRGCWREHSSKIGTNAVNVNIDRHGSILVSAGQLKIMTAWKTDYNKNVYSFMLVVFI